MLKKKACKFLVLLFAIVSLAGFGGETSHAECCIKKPTPIFMEGKQIVISPISIMIKDLEKEIEKDIQRFYEKVRVKIPTVRSGILRLKSNLIKKINEAIKDVISDNISINIAF